MSDDGFSLTDALENSAVGTTIKTVLGLRREAHVCPECGVACEPSEAYNSSTAAFDGGVCPSWYCSECGSHFVREGGEGAHALDLYDRE